MGNVSCVSILRGLEDVRGSERRRAWPGGTVEEGREKGREMIDVGMTHGASTAICRIT